jgi:hypothetical protein
MLNRDFTDILSAFSAERVEYLVVGAHAVAVHARPRATGDLDLWVNASPENARRVWAALSAFGAPLDQLTLADLERDDLIFQIGVVPNRIDVLTGISGVTFAEAWPDRTVITVDGREVPVIGKAALIRNKRASGRPRDLADVADLTGSG